MDWTGSRRSCARPRGSQRLGLIETARSVTLPCAAPYVLTGAKFAVAYSLIGVIGAEFIMSRGGMGYEISFAYTNFDNATMYPLILLILVVSISINAVLSWWEKVLLAQEGAMTGEGWKSARNAAVLIAGLLAAWQLLYWFAGDVGDAAAARHLSVHRAAGRQRSVLAAPVGIDARVCGGFGDCGRGRAVDRVLARASPAVRRGVRADAGRALLDPKDHALPDPAARLRARHAGEDRVWRHPRHHPGRAVHHQRRAQCQADPDQDRPDAAARHARHDALDPVSRPPCRRSSPASGSALRSP